MSITDPSEEYFKDGLWGWAATVWEKLVSSGGRLFTALHGWDGSAWRKLPILWGYSSRWIEAGSDAAAGAGNALVTLTAVPEGYVYVLQCFSVYHDGTAAKAVYVQIVSTGGNVIIYHNLAVTPSEYQLTQCEIVLAYQDYLQGFGIALGDGKTLYFAVTGYKMKVAE